MSAAIEKPSTDAKAEQIRAKFKELLAKTNNEHPSTKDVRVLADLLNGHKGLELWRDVMSAPNSLSMRLLRTRLPSLE